MNLVAAVIGSEKIILVEGQLNADDTVTIINDETYSLEKGERHKAYVVMQKRLRDRLATGIHKVVVKASTGGQYAAKTAILHAAELRGVFLSAVPPQIELIQRQKNSVSRAHSQNVDDYIKDDAFFEENFGGASLRKGSREAALLHKSSEGRAARSPDRSIPRFQ